MDTNIRITEATPSHTLLALARALTVAAADRPEDLQTQGAPATVATIKRLKDKLADAAGAMQEVIDLKAENERLTAKWQAAEEVARGLKGEVGEARARCTS